MTVVALGSVKASPGVTTTMLALASVWPDGRRLVLVEADPDGGVLAARAGLRWEPGLSTLAAAGRHDLGADEVERHAQQFPGGLPVVIGPADPDEATRALEMIGPRMAGALTASDQRYDFLVDVGRLRSGSPAAAFTTLADAVVVVARPRLDELQHVAPRLRAMSAADIQVGLLLVGERPHEPGEVAATLRAPVLGVVAEDRSGASALAGEGRGGGLHRSLLVRSAKQVVPRVIAFAAADGSEGGRGRPTTASAVSGPGGTPGRDIGMSR